MLRVKVCGMSGPLNVKGLNEAKPDFIGYIFYSGSPRYVGDDPDPGLFKVLNEETKKVGVFVNESLEKIIKVSSEYGLDFIQLHGNESPDYCSRLKSSGLKIIKAFSIGNDFHFRDVNRYSDLCDYFLFDTKSRDPGGSGMKFNWELLKKYSHEKPYFLSGGICADDAALLKTIEADRFFGVDINSRFETSPGIKDIELVHKFIKEIKS